MIRLLNLLNFLNHNDQKTFFIADFFVYSRWIVGEYTFPGNKNSLEILQNGLRGKKGG